MENEEKRQETCEVQIKDKAYLTLSEAKEYFNISVNRLRELTEHSGAVLWVTNKRLINRVQFEKELIALQSVKRKENHYGKKRKSK